MAACCVLSDSKHIPMTNNPAMHALTQTLLDKYGESVRAIIFYGSCLRSGDLFDGLVDLYLIVDNYSSVYTNRLMAIANYLLPPNVFYIEKAVADKIVRAKYAILSADDFTKGVSTHWFQSYLWGRFTQPIALVYYRDDASRRMVNQSCTIATDTFLKHVLPMLPPNGSVKHLWIQGLQLSYHTELRAEQTDRTTQLVDAALEHYLSITRQAAATLPHNLQLNDSGEEMLYQTQISQTSRRRSQMRWAIRKLQGKLLSMLRLLKALFTFDGGLDYLAWKLERHSGRKVVVPQRVKRYPLIFIWGFAWRLYRRGAFFVNQATGQK